MTTSGSGPDDEQLALVRAPAARRARVRPTEPLADDAPVAQVAVDVPFAHLDRPFDYAVPASMGETAVVGARVRVRFSGRLVDGFVLDRRAGTEHGTVDKLARLQRAVSPEPVLTPAVATLARAVADRYAGTLADVLRLAVPPRHARAEAQAHAAVEPPPLVAREPADVASAWHGTRSSAAFLAALGRGDAPRAVWAAPPGASPMRAVAQAIGATVESGRGALVVAPDGRDVDALAGAIERVAPGRSVVLTAGLGPAERYRRWLSVLRGEVSVVVGTRAAMFAPVRDLGLAVVWDDGDDLHAEPRAPYPHVREVLALRAHHEQAALLVAGHACTAEAARLVSTGWAKPLTVARGAVRASAPQVRTVGDDADLARDPAARSARLPSVAWEAARRALADGPVLVQVPRRGYAPSLACARCREPARCTHCAGPLAASEDGRASCGWCGRPATAWACANCDGRAFRAIVVGARRTAEELARAFPGVKVRTSGRDGVLASVPDEPALVVATPGAEPVVDGGAYAGALLLDGDRLVARPDLRAAEEALRRWLNAAVLVRPASDGGAVVIVADPSLAPVQALVRWDPVGAAERELAERATLHLPPAARVATLTGPAEAVADLVRELVLPAGAETLGPTVVERPRTSVADVGDAGDVQMLVRVPVSEGAALADALRAASGVRSARKAADHVQVKVDPAALG